MEPPRERSGERVFRGYLSSADVERLYPAGSPASRAASSLMRSGAASTRKCRASTGSGAAAHFNGIEYFHFRFPEQGARMAAFLCRQRLHRLVPGSSEAPTLAEVDAEWVRLAQEREAILAWARSTRMLIEIVQAYRFERRQGACSSTAHAVAAKVVEKAARRSPTR